MLNIAIAKTGNGNQLNNSLLQEIIVMVLKEAAIDDHRRPCFKPKNPFLFSHKTLNFAFKRT